MDLAKAKSVIIAILIAFNIFLIYNNFSYFKGQGIQKDTVKNAAAILNTRGLTLECDIPGKAIRTSRLKFGNGKLDRPAIARNFFGNSYLASGSITEYEANGKKLVFLSNTKFEFTDADPASGVDLGNSEEVRKYAREYLKDKGLLDGSYIIDELVPHGDGSLAVIFIEEYKGFLVYDNYCTVTVTNRGIIKVEYSKFQIIGFSSHAVDDLAAAYQVLLAYFKEDSSNTQKVSGAQAAGNIKDTGSTKPAVIAGTGTGSIQAGDGDGSGAVITGMDIGYKFPADQSLNGMESIELLPVWRVKLKGEAATIYLNTYDASAL